MPLEENRYGQRDVQRALLRMVIDIDRVCRKHGIEYSVYGGTMLGAVREGGFIPWDDDLDIVFTAEALNAFVRVFPSESAAYTVDENDTWVRRVVPRETGDGPRPFVDLFHYESITNEPVRRRAKLLWLRTLQGMLKERIDYSQYSLKNKALVAATQLLGRPFSKARKLGWYRATAARMARGDGALYHVADDCFAGLSHLYAPDCFERFQDISFEGQTLRISAEYEGMLATKYGKDYMTPPPESERRPTHSVGER